MGVFDKLKNMIGIEDGYYDDDYVDDYYDELEENNKVDYQESEEEVVNNETINTRPTSRQPNIVNMTTSSNKMKISIQEPLTYDDGPSIVDQITALRTVVLNLEMLEVDKKRQIFDFVSGGVYALQGNIQKVTKDIYVIVPKGVDVDSANISDAMSKKSLYQV